MAKCPLGMAERRAITMVPPADQPSMDVPRTKQEVAMLVIVINDLLRDVPSLLARSAGKRAAA